MERGGNPVPDVVLSSDQDFTFGSASSNSDAVRLVHCGFGVADTVVYGEPNSDLWLDDSGNVSVSFAPGPESGVSIARIQNGVDSDHSGDDFVLSPSNTPGAPNPDVVCQEGGSVKINEFYPNPPGADSGQEWLELYNGGSETVRLDLWTVETASSSWSSKVIFPQETEIAPGEYFVVGDEGAISTLDLVSRPICH